ncbi:MAG: DUF732 domain-containing protein [Pseudonocardiaceae bacterium]
MRIKPVLVVTALALTLTGCATDDPATPSPTTSTVPPTTRTAPPPIPSTEIPIEQIGRVAFLGALMSIDVELMQEPERSLEAGQTVCADIDAGKPEQTIIDNARKEFSSDTLALTEDQARRIVEAARTNIC